MKKSQVTIFIIIGLVLALTIYLTFNITSFMFGSETEDEQDDILDFNEKISLKSYVENCINTVSEKNIYDIGLNGGTFDNSRNEFIEYVISNETIRKSSSFRKLCSQAGYIGCVNSLLTLEEIEYELKTKIQDNSVGYHQIIWNGKNKFGNFVNNGVYFGYLVAQTSKIIKRFKLKIVVIKSITM